MAAPGPSPALATALAKLQVAARAVSAAGGNPADVAAALCVVFTSAPEKLEVATGLLERLQYKKNYVDLTKPDQLLERSDFIWTVLDLMLAPKAVRPEVAAVVGDAHLVAVAGAAMGAPAWVGAVPPAQPVGDAAGINQVRVRGGRGSVVSAG